MEGCPSHSFYFLLFYTYAMPLLFLLQVKKRMALGCVPTKRWGAAKWRTTARPTCWVAWTEWRRQRPRRGTFTQRPRRGTFRQRPLRGAVPQRPRRGNVIQGPGVPKRDIRPVANMGLATTMRQLQERQSAWFLFTVDQMYEGVGGRGKPLPGLEGGVFIL